MIGVAVSMNNFLPCDDVVEPPIARLAVFDPLRPDAGIAEVMGFVDDDDVGLCGT